MPVQIQSWPSPALPPPPPHPENSPPMLRLKDAAVSPSDEPSFSSSDYLSSHLLQSLLDCAQIADSEPDSTTNILLGLRDSVSDCGDPRERIAFYFRKALCGRLSSKIAPSATAAKSPLQFHSSPKDFTLSYKAHLTLTLPLFQIHPPDCQPGHPGSHRVLRSDPHRGFWSRPGGSVGCFASSPHHPVRQKAFKDQNFGYYGACAWVFSFLLPPHHWKSVEGLHQAKMTLYASVNCPFKAFQQGQKSLFTACGIAFPIQTMIFHGPLTGSSKSIFF